MPIAAVPEYLGNDLSDCPPGHRFTLYGAFWEKQSWKRVKNIELTHLKPVSKNLSPATATLRDALIQRQHCLAERLGEGVSSYLTKSVSPFVTGTGIEHPLENGMAFVNPYGLPYLPGSGVKGALRKAAEELADAATEEDNGWTKKAIEVLFGKQPRSVTDKAERGALTFWDVFPDCSKLCIEIMTPHYSDYYQGNTSPHDAGAPIPIYFIAVPAESDFAFHVQCDVRCLKDKADLSGQWRKLLDSAFDHAFDWLGFGAKTAVGYGHMRIDTAATKRNEDERRKSAVQATERREREKQEQDLQDARGHLPEDAVWIEKQFMAGEWSDTNRFLVEVEKFLAHKRDLSNEAYDRLVGEISDRWPGILENPDVVRGKKKKPKYKPRPRELAKKLIALKPEAKKSP